MFRRLREIINPFRSDHDYLSYEDCEFTQVSINGVPFPANPDYVFLPTRKRPYFIFIYEKNTIVATGSVKVVYQGKIETQEKEDAHES